MMVVSVSYLAGWTDVVDVFYNGCPLVAVLSEYVLKLSPINFIMCSFLP